MKRTLLLLAAVAAAAVMTSCGTRVPRWEELVPDEERHTDFDTTEDEDATGSEDYAVTDREEVLADGEAVDIPDDEEAPEKTAEDKVTVYEDSGDTAEIAERLTEGFVGDFAFGYDEESWEVLAQPGIGYFLSYKGAEDSCQVIVSSDSSGDMDTIMNALTGEYDDGSFGDISEEELNGLSVRRVKGSAEGMKIELLLSQPKTDSDVLVVQFISDGQAKTAESEAKKVMDSFKLR